MLKPVPKIDPFDQLRASEFSRLDEHGIAYLDYAGAALYSASQATAFSEHLHAGVYGNPHSAHAPSQASECELETARAATLAFFEADPAIYDVCFTANTSAAIKLVAESYRFGAHRGLALSADNHNSVNGIREFARTAGAPIATLPLDEALRLDDPRARLAAFANQHHGGLFAFPAQSNFSGVKHPLDLVEAAQGLGLDVLIDAAGVGACGGVSLRQHPADFLAFSFYKIFGLPTGVGALIAKREALARLRRPWFAGGTVAFVSIEHDRHQMRIGHDAFEDGTPNFLNGGAIETGFDFLARIDSPHLQQRMERLTAYFINTAVAMTRRDGAPLVRIHGPANTDARGGVVAFNIRRSAGSSAPYQEVEDMARKAGVAIRGGCFCNPGAAERAFGFHNFDIASCLDELASDFTIPRFQARLGPTATAGALRLSVGLATSFGDIDRALAVIADAAPD